MPIICVPLSSRGIIERVWTSDTIYTNCHSCKCEQRDHCDRICIYDLISDTDKNLCPRKVDNLCAATSEKEEINGP